MNSLIEKRLQENWSKERSSIRLRNAGKALLLSNVLKACDPELSVLRGYSSPTNEDLDKFSERVQYSCHNNVSQYPLLSLLSLKATMYTEVDQIVVSKLKASIFFALVAEDDVFNFVTISEAANEIRLMLSSTAYAAKIRLIPKQLSVIETLEFLCNEISGHYNVSNAYLRIVHNGWSSCSDHKEERPLKVKKRIRSRRPKIVVKEPVDIEAFPFGGNNLDIEDAPDVNIVELDEDSIAPSIKAERDLFRNKILTTNEQFGLTFIAHRLTSYELSKVTLWINNAQPTASTVLAFLTILTSLKLHEVLGLHLAVAEGDTDSFKQSDGCYGIVDIASGVYWRKGLDISDRYEPSETDLKWLLPHTEWLALPIPNPFLKLLRAFFARYQAGLIEQVLPDDVSQKSNDLLTRACSEIVHYGGLNRRLSQKVLRYLLYGCVASNFGRHKAALIFANNEFGLSTWHYYMSDSARHLQLVFMTTCSESLGFDFEQQADLTEVNSVIGSKLAINRSVFSERLAERVESLNVSLRSVRKNRSLDALREIYNQLVSYTVLMFCAVTSHRRNKSMFIEHYCWNDDYTSVLIADKIHFGESATRIIPIPELMSKQINNTLGWIEQIIKRVKLLDKKMALKLKSSIHRDSNASFLGLWLDNKELATPSTAQIEVFMGDDWTLPQNAVRHLSYHTLFNLEEAVPFLDHQMGHISTDMHSYQNTSLIRYGGPEVEIHRKVISRCLDRLGFSLLGRTSFSHLKMYNKGQFAPRSIQKKSRNQSKSTEQIIRAGLKSLLDKAIKTNHDFYELLSEHYRDDPYLHEQALVLLRKLELNNDEHTEIDSDKLHSALVSYFKKSPVAKAVLPYDTMFSERNYTQIKSAFYGFAEALITNPKQVSSETLTSILLFSMILDGTGSLSSERLRKSVAISSVRYSNSYLTAKIDNEKLVFFGGLSALILAMLIKREEVQHISLNPQVLEQLMNGKCPESKFDKTIANNFTKLLALFRQMHDKKMTFSKLYQLIDHAPRRSETGALYGLRQNIFRVKGLSEHTLFRLLDHKHRYIMPSSGGTTMNVIAERSFFKAKSRKNDYFKLFMSDFRNKFGVYPGTSKEKIISFWQEQISSDRSEKLSDLVNSSKGLPEITVLVLTWLYVISGRKGQRYGGLAPSTILTYFSKVVPRLFEFAANKSLTVFDYEDFSDLYQDIIDAGDIENRAERAKILVRFHSVIHDYFGVAQFDFRDLDVEEHEESLTGRIIMPWEYQQALSLLLSDKDMNTEERLTNALILVLCCRLGLRREEIRRLKLRDFSCEEQVLYVRTHRISKETVRVKSKSGNRRIPYSWFLNEEELEILDFYIEKAKGQKNKSVPLFFDLVNPKEIRHMDSQFSRVIEVLKLVTGDPEMRLHDGRHTFISFTATSLVLEDRQQDPISKVVKEWVRTEAFSSFQKRFMETAIAIPSTRHALLPALALMAGHSNATTTLSSYTHLIDYWQWLSVEMEFKKVKTLDGTLSALARINRKHLTEMKSGWGLSASYAVLKRIKKETPLKVEGFKVKSFDQKPSLSTRDKDSITPVISQVQLQEKGLRYLEDVQKQFHVAPDAEPIKPSDPQYGLTSHYVESLRQAYQLVLTNEVSYRAYKISSNEEGVDFVGQPRLYEARNYFKDPNFYTLLAHLIRLQQSNEQAFGELNKVWAQAWYDATKKLYIPTSQIGNAKSVFSSCMLSFDLGSERINRRVGGVVYDSVPVLSLKLNNKPISVPQFSHAMFQMRLMEIL